MQRHKAPSKIYDQTGYVTEGAESSHKKWMSLVQQYCNIIIKEKGVDHRT
jgi:hypothetical protein